MSRGRNVERSLRISRRKQFDDESGRISEVLWTLTFGCRAALLLALSAGALTGVLASYYLNNSRYSVEVSALATYRPPQVTTIYADDGETILAEFAIEKRIPIKIQDVPRQRRPTRCWLSRIIAFATISGSILTASPASVFKNITTGKTEGASTITQQLAKNLFLYKDQTYTRKVNEWAVALQIERLYTKDQILEMYMNYVFLGAGSYGFEAGSRTYFGKSLKDLNLEEAALLAAIPKSPEYSPTRNMEKAQDAPRHRARPDGESIFPRSTRRRRSMPPRPSRSSSPTRLITSRSRNRRPGIIRSKRSANISKKNTRHASPRAA